MERTTSPLAQSFRRLPSFSMARPRESTVSAKYVRPSESQSSHLAESLSTTSHPATTRERQVLAPSVSFKTLSTFHLSSALSLRPPRIRRNRALSFRPKWPGFSRTRFSRCRATKRRNLSSIRTLQSPQQPYLPRIINIVKRHSINQSCHFRRCSAGDRFFHRVAQLFML